MRLCSVGAKCDRTGILDSDTPSETDKFQVAEWRTYELHGVTRLLFQGERECFDCWEHLAGRKFLESAERFEE